jgi:hypothetical protein
VPIAKNNLEPLWGRLNCGETMFFLDTDYWVSIVPDKISNIQQETELEGCRVVTKRNLRDLTTPFWAVL